MIRMQCQEDNESTCGGQMQMGWCKSSRREHNLDVVSALMADEKLTLFKRLLVEFYSGMPLPSYTLGNCYPPSAAPPSLDTCQLPIKSWLVYPSKEDYGGFFWDPLKKNEEILRILQSLFWFYVETQLKIRFEMGWPCWTKESYRSGLIIYLHGNDGRGGGGGGGCWANAAKGIGRPSIIL